MESSTVYPLSLSAGELATFSHDAAWALARNRAEESLEAGYRRGWTRRETIKGSVESRRGTRLYHSERQQG